MNRNVNIVFGRLLPWSVKINGYPVCSVRNKSKEKVAKIHWFMFTLLPGEVAA